MKNPRIFGGVGKTADVNSPAAGITVRRYLHFLVAASKNVGTRWIYAFFTLSEIYITAYTTGYKMLFYIPNPFIIAESKTALQFNAECFAKLKHPPLFLKRLVHRHR